MRLVTANYNNPVMYRANDGVKAPQTHKLPDSSEENLKKGYKNTILLAAGLGLLALGLCFRKNIRGLFKEASKPIERETERIKSNESKLENAVELKKDSEIIEEIIPEETDFDTVFGPRIEARKQQQPKQNKVIVIDEKGNVVEQQRTQNRTNNPFEARFDRQRTKQTKEEKTTNYTEDIKNAAIDTADIATDCILWHEILNSGTRGGGSVAEDVISGVEKGGTGIFDGLAERLSNIADNISDNIGGFFDNIGESIGDIGEGIGDSLADIL
ncbi:MAG: hypothetical protein NC200_01200 [Candidatus Gastranaerophilales bacterium]|nr:hypothetical protein [Candidatus Gastranaerophilales bacterium]